LRPPSKKWGWKEPLNQDAEKQLRLLLVACLEKGKRRGNRKKKCFGTRLEGGVSMRGAFDRQKNKEEVGCGANGGGVQQQRQSFLAASKKKFLIAVIGRNAWWTGEEGKP